MSRTSDTVNARKAKAHNGFLVMASKKPKLNWGPKGAWVLPKSLMEHSDFRELTPSAMKILMVLGSQYNGRNNGDLSATKTTVG